MGNHGIVASDWLSSHGEKIRVIQLRGTVAFANVAGVLVSPYTTTANNH